MRNCDIKRVLGVGLATMSDHLRKYKDPFEPNAHDWTLTPIDVDRFALCKQPGAAQDHPTKTERQHQDAAGSSTVSRNNRSNTPKS